MPKALNYATYSADADVKPYTEPSSGKRAGSKGKPWTAEEKTKLFDIAVKKGASVKSFEGQLEGRTGHQCYVTWHNTLKPAIRRSLMGAQK